MKRLFKDKEALSGNNKPAKTVKVDDETQEVNTVKSHDEPIPKKKKGKKHKKMQKIEQYNADPSDDGRIYGIDHINLGETSHDF